MPAMFHCDGFRPIAPGAEVRRGDDWHRVESAEDVRRAGADVAGHHLTPENSDRPMVKLIAGPNFAPLLARP